MSAHPMPMFSWHDFHLTGYAVNGKLQSIVFDLEWPYDTVSDIRCAKVQFSGVECYFLEHDLGSNIVYSIVEAPLKQHLREWTDKFEAECTYGWPSFWRKMPFPRREVEIELENSFAYLESKQAKCFLLSSSYGLSGWVLASSVEHLQVEA